MITISRDSGYADRIRKYKVLVDNKIIGDIGDGETKSFAVSPGKHTLMLKIDWGKSSVLNFTSDESTSLSFSATSPLRGRNISKAIIYSSVRSNKYINLVQIF